MPMWKCCQSQCCQFSIGARRERAAWKAAFPGGGRAAARPSHAGVGRGVPPSRGRRWSAVPTESVRGARGVAASGLSLREPALGLLRPCFARLLATLVGQPDAFGAGESRAGRLGRPAPPLAHCSAPPRGPAEQQRRKPKLPWRKPGMNLKRPAERQSRARLPQPPPRNTRISPDAEPRGSFSLP